MDKLRLFSSIIFNWIDNRKHKFNNQNVEKREKKEKRKQQGNCRFYDLYLNSESNKTRKNNSFDYFMFLFDTNLQIYTIYIIQNA